MAIRQLVLTAGVLLTACALEQGDPEPGATEPSVPTAEDVEVSTSNAMHFSECVLAAPGCLDASGLLGFWSCPQDKGYEIAVGEDGRIEMLNHNGGHGTGCVTCDGTFELVSDADNLGKAWVHVGGKLSANGDDLSASWLECGALDIEACRANPGAARSQTCKSSE